MLKLRIRFTHSQDVMIKNQKFGKQISPSKMSVNNINGGYYINSSPLIDFPMTMKNFEGRFDSKTTMYLSIVHITALKNTLKVMLQGFSQRDLFYLMNQTLNINNDIAENEKQVIPIKGILFEIMYCIVKDMGANNEVNNYEGIRIVNHTTQTFAELTVDELAAFIDLLESIHPAQISLLATKIGFDIATGNADTRCLQIPFNQIL